MVSRCRSNLHPSRNSKSTRLGCARLSALLVASLGGANCAIEAPANTAACIEGTRRSCRCDGGQLGFQRCEDGLQSLCECAAPRTASRANAATGAAPGSTQGPDTSRDGERVANQAGAGASAASSGRAGSGGTPRTPSSNGSSSMAEPGAGDPSSGGASDPASPADPAAGAPLAGEVIGEPNDDAVAIFDHDQLRSYDILVAPADLAAADAQPSAETYIPARLSFEGMEYGPLMMRYKGSNGSFQAPCTKGGLDGAKDGKCSFKLAFDEVDPEARFFGLRKLNFHSLNSDESMLRERLGYALFREFGVAASRAVHARVYINGVFQGLYGVVEQIDGRFTRARFTDGGEGNLYKEVWPLHDDPERYLSRLETNEDDNPSMQNMLDFKRAIEVSADETARFLDLDYLTRFIAVDRVIINDDGTFHFYCQPNGSSPPANHNYYWYEGMTSAQFWIIPWDLDHSFDSAPWAHVEPAWSVEAACTCNAVADAYQTPASCDPLVSRFAEWTDMYEQQVDEFLAGPFAKSKVDAKLNAWSAQIEPVVMEAEGLNLAPSYAEWQEALSEFRTKIDSARQNRGYAY